jgi:hypothetical protein
MKIRYFLMLCALCLTGTLHAQPQTDTNELQWYQVELIVYTNNDPAALYTEHWREPDARPVMEGAVELTSGTGAPATTPFQLLPREQMQLTDVFDKLARDSRYTPRIHVAWRQAVQDRQSATPVQIHSRYPLPADYLEQADIPSHQDQISGTVKISVERYLHISADLLYNRPTAASDAGADVPMDYLLQETRRTRSEELQYLDHPLFGVLVRIVPYELPTTPPAAAAAINKSQ